MPISAPPGRHGADGKADEGAAQPRLPGARPIRGAHPDRAPDRFHLVRAAVALRGDEQRLADREHGHGESRHLDAVEEVGHAEGEARLAGQLVDADTGKGQADEERGEPPKRRVAESGGDGDEGEHHQREIFARAEDERQLDDVGRNKGQSERGDEAGDEGADGCRGKRRTAAAGARHLVALERGDDRGAFAGGVEQDRRGRTPIHAAIIDAGEHDERPGRIELIGDRQEQCDGQCGADAGQHAHGGAERYADECVEKVHRLGSDQQPLQQEIESTHVVGLFRSRR